MARPLPRRKLNFSVLLLSFLAPAAHAVCVSPLLTPTECDFKNEDTHLWLNQPGWRINETKKVNNLIASASQTIDQYLATVKTTATGTIGGVNLPAMMDDIAVSIGQTVARSTAGTGLLLLNDPYKLKNMYLDLSRCLPFWEVVYDETCPSALDLPSSVVKIAEMRVLAEKIRAVKNTPNMILGEEWGAIAEDLEAIKATFDSAKTLGRNFDTATKLAEFENRFSSFDEMLTKPRLTIARWEAERSEVSETLNDTFRDTMKSMHELSQTSAPSTTGTPRTSDADEVVAISNMSRNAVGRMQSMEIDNMSKNHTAQMWNKLVEHEINMGNMMALDYADELQVTNTGRVVDIQRLTPDPLRPTILGNEAGLPRP